MENRRSNRMVPTAKEELNYLYYFGSISFPENLYQAACSTRAFSNSDCLEVEVVRLKEHEEPCILRLIKCTRRSFP
ncbi:MAG: hypothetical protein GY820_28020 [Gammaproteobacteria bacterium]|nr:hypothetical protein [Gammaproteobacteria bacterium]